MNGATTATTRRVLILGGTAEARELSELAVRADVSFISSLAGRIIDPALPVGPVRVGGFGGSAGLAEYLTEHGISAVVDATHPFAATISASAVQACRIARVPLLRLARPGWRARPDASDWHWVDSVAAAAARAPQVGRRAFLTTGRTTLHEYGALADSYTLVRMVQLPSVAVSSRWEVILDRGPYSVPGELDLMRSRRIDVLVTKDSGGTYTSAKLDAAAASNVPVIIVRRPDAAGSNIVETPQAALNWMSEVQNR